METSFKISKKGQYIQIDYVSNLNNLPFIYPKYIWSINKKQAREFIKRVREIENYLQDMINKDNLVYDYRLIIYMHLNAIDNISTGLDIRSSMSSLELAERFLWTYNKKYVEAHTFCKETSEHVEKEGKKDSYVSDWRRHDKHNDLVKEFNLPFKTLTLEDFRKNELKEIDYTLDEMIKIIKGED